MSEYSLYLTTRKGVTNVKSVVCYRGSRGLGRNIVEVALEAGEMVVATARKPEQLQDLG